MVQYTFALPVCTQLRVCCIVSHTLVSLKSIATTKPYSSRVQCAGQQISPRSPFLVRVRGAPRPLGASTPAMRRPSLARVRLVCEGEHPCHTPSLDLVTRVFHITTDPPSPPAEPHASTGKWKRSEQGWTRRKARHARRSAEHYEARGALVRLRYTLGVVDERQFQIYLEPSVPKKFTEHHLNDSAGGSSVASGPSGPKVHWSAWKQTNRKGATGPPTCGVPTLGARDPRSLSSASLPPTTPPPSRGPSCVGRHISSAVFGISYFQRHRSRICPPPRPMHNSLCREQSTFEHSTGL